MRELLDALRRRGWTIRERETPAALLPVDLRPRYPAVPSAVADFLGRLEVCHNRAEDVWVLTPGEFLETDSEGFRWNEYESMSLEARDGGSTE
jgi:hypothetical protein